MIKSLRLERDPVQIKRVKRSLFGPVDHAANQRVLKETFNQMIQECNKQWGFDFCKGIPIDKRWERLLVKPKMSTLASSSSCCVNDLIILPQSGFKPVVSNPCDSLSSQPSSHVSDNSHLTESDRLPSPAHSGNMDEETSCTVINKENCDDCQCALKPTRRLNTGGSRGDLPPLVPPICDASLKRETTHKCPSTGIKRQRSIKEHFKTQKRRRSPRCRTTRLMSSSDIGTKRTT